MCFKMYWQYLWRYSKSITNTSDNDSCSAILTTLDVTVEIMNALSVHIECQAYNHSDDHVSSVTDHYSRPNAEENSPCCREH